MKPSRTLLLLVVGSLLAGGCQKQHDSSTAAQNPGDTPEHKTVELVDKAGECTDWKHYEEWNSAGWSVTSVSRPFPQPDGTVLRKIELARRAR
ncbi:MAG TPA: hypothetical protein VKY92_13720 [Verrucomicrobiae bacterium]|nr:hypothetical protein [Verrucomicrobiae bacterium]